MGFRQELTADKFIKCLRHSITKIPMVSSSLVELKLTMRKQHHAARNSLLNFVTYKIPILHGQMEK